MNHYSEDGNIRTIENNDEHFVWHRDAEDRRVTLIDGNNWFLQMEHALPKLLKKNEEVFIEKEKWHRVLCPDSNLDNSLIIQVIKLEEKDDHSG
tara:strand:- start:59 stop:340 length:282 start_codon:yes stop_codon:yes gene_type:complete